MRIPSLTCVVVVSDGVLRQHVMARLAEAAAGLSDHCEILVVANGVSPGTATELVELANGVPDLTVQFLADAVEPDTAILIGMDRAIGDWVVTLTPTEAEVDALPDLLAAARGYEVAFAAAPGMRGARLQDVAGRLFFWVSGRLAGAPLDWPTPALRAFSRAATRWLTSRIDGALLIRSIAFRGAFPGRRVIIEALANTEPRRSWTASLRKACGHLGRTGTLPLRLAIALASGGMLAGFGALAYVVVIFSTRTDVQPGWTTLTGLLATMMIVFSALFALLTAHILAMYASIQPRNRMPVIREVRSARRRLDRSLDVTGNVALPVLGAPLDAMPDIRPYAGDR
jgi:hypothetical protein